MTTIEKEQFWTQIVENPSLWGTIQTGDKSFDTQAENIWTVMNETFIKNGSLKEVNRWELMLGDRLENNGEGTLNERKARILKRITEHPPVSIKILEGLIKEITDDAYIFDYDKKENKLTLEFPEDLENDIKDLIPRVIPVISDVTYSYNLPSGYLVAEFLESSGQGERIKTEIYLAGDSYVTCEYMLIQSQGVNTVFGYYRNPYFYFSANYGGYGGSPYYRYGTQGTYIESVNGVAMAKEINRKRLVEVKAGIITIDGVTPTYYGTPPDHEETFITGWNCYVFGADGNQSQQKMRVYKFSAHSETQGSVDLLPCIDAQGVPCMYDKVAGKPLYNEYNGAFIVGMNIAQARKLGKLPASGGSLTVSLPNDYTGDMLIKNAIAEATSNEWTLTIQTYTPENSASEASTFGMPRIWVRKVQTENGSYVDNENNRYQVEWCVTMYTPDNSTPDQHGYEQFRSVEAACEYWGLTQWIDPEIENMLEQ